MKRSLFVLSVLPLLVPSSLWAQESAAAGQASTTGTPAITNAPGLLTPPPDNPPTTSSSAPTTPTLEPATTTTTTTTTVRTSTSQPMTPREIARVQQQEIIRRQELVFRANQSLSDAAREEAAGQYPLARRDYLFAANAYGTISRRSAHYAEAAQGLERVDFVLYDAALQAGDTPRAKMLIDEVVNFNPDDKIALEKQARTDRALSDPNDTSILGNPAITPAFIKQVNEVQRLFTEAEQYRRTGQWDQAEADLKRILGMDPYNIAASKQLERIDAEKDKYADVARDETRTERLRQVEEKWYEPIQNRDVTSQAQEEQPELTRTTNFDMEQRLRNLFVTLDFSNATIEEAANFISSESKRLDEPSHKGVNFIIQPDASSSAKPITLALNNVPITEALRYICQLANVKYKIEDYAISIVPFTASTEDVVNRNFIVPPSFFSNTSSSGITDVASTIFNSRRPVAPAAGTAPDATPDAAPDTAQSILEAKGVKFTATGSSAIYNSATSQLTVNNTADQMEFIEELVSGAQAPTLMVRVSTKFVEINQQDLNDLTVNSGLSLLDPTFSSLSTAGAPLNVLGVPLRVPSIVTRLPGAAGFTSDTIDSLIDPQALAENGFVVRGVLTGLQFDAVFRALSQKRSFDELNEPTALTKSGEEATLEAVRVFPYPVAFDPPEVVQAQETGASITVITPNPPTIIATTPTDFKRRNVGVRLVIKPQVSADTKNVDLALFPEVTDFDGFINYGSPIFVPDPVTGVDALLTPNTLNQPVFDTRRINTKVLIRDGSTVVLGGLIREDLQTINDKVPVLGDIPLIGRLFQSKATQSTKRNLIIFVSANIYRNDGELLNPPEIVNAADILTGRAGYTPTSGAQ